jgi:hypothetical protein
MLCMCMHLRTCKKKSRVCVVCGVKCMRKAKAQAVENVPRMLVHHRHSSVIGTLAS